MNLKNIKFLNKLNKIYKIKLKKLFLILFVTFTLGIIYHHQEGFPLKILSSHWHKIIEYFPDLNHRLYSMQQVEINKNYTPLKRKEIFIIYNYSNGMSIFSDTNYYDRSKVKKNNLILVQIPRHHNKLINLVVVNKTKIIRVLCDRNDNNFYSDWNSIEIDFKIIGKSCIHYLPKYKIYEKGIISLPPGGPESSDPLFIEKKDLKNIKLKLLSN